MSRSTLQINAKAISDMKRDIVTDSIQSARNITQQALILDKRYNGDAECIYPLTTSLSVPLAITEVFANCSYPIASRTLYGAINTIVKHCNFQLPQESNVLHPQWWLNATQMPDARIAFEAKLCRAKEENVNEDEPIFPLFGATAAKTSASLQHQVTTFSPGYKEIIQQ